MEKNSRSEVEAKVKHILISQLEIRPSILAESSSTTPLLGRGIGLDSMEVMALVAALEREFDIEIPDEDLTTELVKDIGNLAEYLLQKISKG